MTPEQPEPRESAPKLSVAAFKLQVALVLQSVTAIWDDMTKFADAEIPFAAGDGMTLTLANAPNPASSLQLFYNGLEQHGSYALTGNVIVFSGDIGDDPDLLAWSWPGVPEQFAAEMYETAWLCEEVIADLRTLPTNRMYVDEFCELAGVVTGYYAKDQRALDWLFDLRHVTKQELERDGVYVQFKRPQLTSKLTRTYA